MFYLLVFQGELALMISELEAENQALQEEYERLRGRSNLLSSGAGGSMSASMYGSFNSSMGGGPQPRAYSALGGSYDLGGSMITSPSPGSECGDARLANGDTLPSEEGETCYTFCFNLILS
jgi:hypothetical protein